VPAQEAEKPFSPVNLSALLRNKPSVAVDGRCDGRKWGVDMLMLKVVSGFAAAALVAAAVIALPGFSPEVEARTPPPSIKGDRLDIRSVGQDCSLQAWPYYEADCLRDRSRADGHGRQVRLIAIDQINR
jgi:hypothetical protein